MSLPGAADSLQEQIKQPAQESVLGQMINEVENARASMLDSHGAVSLNAPLPQKFDSSDPYVKTGVLPRIDLTRSGDPVVA